MRIHHIAISVKNLKASVDFYRDNFSFEVIKEFTKPGWDGGAVLLKLNDLQLEVFQFRSSTMNNDDMSNLKVIGLKHIGIQVDSVFEVYNRLKMNNVDIDEPVKGTTCAFFCFLRDPNGIPLELYQVK
jgi:glyoxylase I family protein